MTIEKYNYRGDINLGFYATLTDEYVVVPREWKREELLPDKKAVTKIAGTRLVGLFTAGNSSCLLLPESVKEREKKKIEDAGINCQVLDSNENALGNLILANESGALISPKIQEFEEEIAEALNLEVRVGKIAGNPNPGVCGIANNYGALIHRDASEEDAEKAKEILQVERIDIGTINMGSPYISSGIICNNEDILVGEDTTGPEIGRIDRTLVEKE